MIAGSVVGLVMDNRDPDKMHRVLVQYPVAGNLKSSWCRMITPMGGVDRGLVMLPDIGTEVLLTFSYRTHHPYVLGALYNGGDDYAPDPMRALRYMQKHIQDGNAPAPGTPEAASWQGLLASVEAAVARERASRGPCRPSPQGSRPWRASARGKRRSARGRRR